MATVTTPPAYVTIAFDNDGAVIIQQIQRRRVIKDDDGHVLATELLAPQLIKAPLEGDTIEATLTEALDAVTAGLMLKFAALGVDPNAPPA